MYSLQSHEPTLCSRTSCRHAHIWHLPRSPFMHAEKALLQPTESIPICDLAAENLPVFLLLYNKLAGGQAALKIQPLKMFSHVYVQMSFQVWGFPFFFQFCTTRCSDRCDWWVCLGHTQVNRGRVALGGEDLGRSWCFESLGQEGGPPYVTGSIRILCVPLALMVLHASHGMWT